jgi:hypothetical protein
MSLHPKLKEAIDGLQIADVTLKSINAFLIDEFDPEALSPNEALSLQTVFPSCRMIKRYEGMQGNVPRTRVVFEMFAGLRILRARTDGYQSLSSEELEKLVCATIECHFLVSYEELFVTKDFLDEECLSLFAQHNVPFNMWPYWREVVQSACSRMGLPRIVLPTHRLRQSATMKKDDHLMSSEDQSELSVEEGLPPRSGASA